MSPSARQPSASAELRRAGVNLDLAPVLLHRPDLLEDTIGLGDTLRLGRIDEGELERIAEPEMLHLQDDAGEIRSQNLGIGEVGTLHKILFRKKPDTHPFADAAAPSAPLARARL